VYLPDNFSSSNRERPAQKPKPHYPADPIGKRYVNYFWHPFKSIIATAPTEEEPFPAWRTSNYYLQPSTFWGLHQNQTKLVGVRFDSTTRYATIDLDADGEYHNQKALQRIKYALEDIGIVSTILVQSSHSGGYHLIITFPTPQPTFDLACALEYALRDIGFLPRRGHLEIFPNVKAYDKLSFINYNAIRCPMQPNSGALLLDDDNQPISDDVSVFLDYCDRASVRQDLKQLKSACKKARKRHNRTIGNRKASADVLEWRANWEEIIATGWTGFGQTNTILQIFVGYGIVFLGLKDDLLISYCLNGATNARGYVQYCRHQHEIEAKIRDWVNCTTRHKWYTPYAGNPERLLKTFGNTFAEAMADISGIIKPQDNLISFDRRKANKRNQKLSDQVQKRIKTVVDALSWGIGLPDGITDRKNAISEEYKQRFDKSLSNETLRKHIHLWHPNWYIPDPWVENSQNSSKSSQTSMDGQFDPKNPKGENLNPSNPSQISMYGQFSYIKVICLPPAAPAPKGLGSAEEILENGECNDQFAASQPESNWVANVETENSNEEVTNLHDSNNPNNFNNLNNQFSYLLVYLINFQFNQNQNKNNFYKYFLFLFSGGKLKKIHKFGLSNETEKDLDIPNDQNQESDNLQYVEQLKLVTKLRLQAGSHARKSVRQYCLISGRFFTGGDRALLEERAKYQYYLDSRCEKLVREAEVWAAEHPGCLPFRLEEAFS
jgi:hypothetical protein